MTIEEICNKYIKVKATGKLALHQHPKQDWAFKVVLGKESDVCNGCFLEKYYPLRLPYTCAAQQREDGKNVQFKEISKTMITRENAKELLPIIEAFAEGKTIQDWTNNTWKDKEYTSFGELSQSPIKHQPKYKPFKSQEECWNEMLKHQPFGWIKNNDTQRLHNIGAIGRNNYGIEINNSILYFDLAFNTCNFIDGAPFGIREEE